MTTVCFSFQQMAPAKQAKVIKEFQKQSAQMDMTVILSLSHLYFNLLIHFFHNTLYIFFFFFFLINEIGILQRRNTLQTL
jgi:hypothetical protein